jgi:PAS domain S-box-containing protein
MVMKIKDLPAAASLTFEGACATGVDPGAGASYAERPGVWHLDSVAEETDPSMNGVRQAAIRYAVAVLSVAAGLALRFALAGLLGSAAPYTTFFAAVMFAAWYGGLGPGMLASVLSLTAALYFLIPPIYHFGPMSREDTAAAIVFVGVSIFVSILNEALRRSQARSERRSGELTLETSRRAAAEAELTESKREAEHSRDLLRTILASIGDGVIATDGEGKVTFLNAVAEELTGCSRADALGTPISQVFVTTRSKHKLLTGKDGREIPIEDLEAPLRNEGGKMLGAVRVFRDVTGRRKAEQAGARSEERLELALDAGQVGFWDWDVAQNRMEWSDRVYDMHGVQRGKVWMGTDEMTKLIHPEDRENTIAIVVAAMEQGERFHVENRVVQPGGEVVWVATTGLVIRNEKGEATRILGAITDITTRKQAENELRQQWRMFDTALSNTPDFNYVFDLEGRFRYVNRARLVMFQKTYEEVVGKNFWDLNYPPELAERFHRQIQEVIDTKVTIRDQAPFTGPSGITRRYEYIFVPVLSADGQVEAVVGTTHDITDQKLIEEALRKSEERLTLALEAGGGVGAWDWELPADRVYVNPQFAKLFGIDAERAAGGVPVAEFFTAMHPEDARRVQENILRAARTGGEVAEEYRIIQKDRQKDGQNDGQKDGSVRWIYARGRCHLDAAGQPARFPGVVFDITERKHAEEALRGSQDRLRAIYDGTYEYMGLLAADGTVLEANRASLEFANNTREDVVGRPFWDTPWFQPTPGASEAIRESVARAAAGESIRLEASLLRPSGESLTFDISLHPIVNELGEVALIVPEGRNITERKRAEEEVKRSNQQLTRVNRELEEFAYVASHDLQEPLRIVNIYTQLILQELGAVLQDPGAVLQNPGADKAQLAQYADFVQQGVKRMDALIHDLLTFSRAVHAEELAVGTVDLGVSLREALSVLKNRVEECGCQVRAAPLPTVRGDAAQMAHVFQNLLSNALKYCKKDTAPEIDICALRDGDYWTISVRDNGIGFEPQYAERIFGLFKRLHKDEYPGTGLGLAICKRIVERYGGRIWAESRLGEGARFYFSLPAADGR